MFGSKQTGGPAWGFCFYGDPVIAFRAVADLTPNKHVRHFSSHRSQVWHGGTQRGPSWPRLPFPHLHSEMTLKILVSLLTAPPPQTSPQIVCHICARSRELDLYCHPSGQASHQPSEKPLDSKEGPKRRKTNIITYNFSNIARSLKS